MTGSRYCCRLLRLSAAHPELFDIGVTGVDKVLVRCSPLVILTLVLTIGVIGVSQQDVWWTELTPHQQRAFKASLRAVSAACQQRAGCEPMMQETTEWEDSTKKAPKYKFVINVSAVLSSWRLAQLLATGAHLTPSQHRY